MRSTAVPGLAAKPIIDLIVQLNDAAQLVPVIQKLEALGYKHEGNLGDLLGNERPSQSPSENRVIIFMCAFPDVLNCRTR